MYSGSRQQKGGPIGFRNSRSVQLWSRRQTLLISRNVWHKYHYGEMGWGIKNCLPCNKIVKQSIFSDEFHSIPSVPSLISLWMLWGYMFLPRSPDIFPSFTVLLQGRRVLVQFPEISKTKYHNLLWVLYS